MSLLDFFVEDPDYEVENHPLSDARRLYEDAGVSVPKNIRRATYAVFEPVSDAGNDALPDFSENQDHGGLAEALMSMEDGDVDMLGSELIPDPRLDGRDMMSGKRPVCNMDDYDGGPLPKRVVASTTSSFGTVTTYGNTQSAFGVPSVPGSIRQSCSSPSAGSRQSFNSTPPDVMDRSLSFQFTTVPASGNQGMTSLPSASVRRFVPAWEFGVEDDGRSVDSVRDYLNNMVPPKRVAESKTQGTSQLVDAADMDLFNGIMGYVLARKRVASDHERLQNTCADLRLGLSKVENELRTEKAAKLEVERELSLLQAEHAEDQRKLVDMGREKEELVCNMEAQGARLAHDSLDLAQVKSNLEAERETSAALRAQLQLAVQAKQNVIVGLPGLVKEVLKHEDVMGVLKSFNQASCMFGKHLASRKLQAKYPDIDLPDLDPESREKMVQISKVYEAKDFPILGRLAENVDATIDDLLAILHR